MRRNSQKKLLCLISFLVIQATRVHPVPSRTRQLSSLAPMVLGGQPPGRVGHCQGTFHLNSSRSTLIEILHLCKIDLFHNGRWEMKIAEWISNFLLSNPWIFVILYYLTKLIFQAAVVYVMGVRKEIFGFVPKFGPDFGFMGITMIASDFVSYEEGLTMGYVLSTGLFFIWLASLFSVAYGLYLYQKRLGDEGERIKTRVGKRWDSPMGIHMARLVLTIISFGFGSFVFASAVDAILS